MTNIWLYTFSTLSTPWVWHQANIYFYGNIFVHFSYIFSYIRTCTYIGTENRNVLVHCTWFQILPLCTSLIHVCSRLAVIADGIDPFGSDLDIMVGDNQAVHNENEHLNFEKQGPRSVFGQLNYSKNWDTGSERHTDTSFYDETPRQNKTSIQCQTLPDLRKLT